MPVFSPQEYTKLRLKLFRNVLIFSVLPAAIFIGLGLFLDNLLQLKPLLTIIALIISFILTNFLLIRNIKKSFLPTNLPASQNQSSINQIKTSAQTELKTDVLVK